MIEFEELFTRTSDHRGNCTASRLPDSGTGLQRCGRKARLVELDSACDKTLIRPEWGLGQANIWVDVAANQG